MTTPTASTTTIDPIELASLCKLGKAENLIDVRTPPEYSAVHAQNAQLHPLYSLDPKAIAAAAKPDQPIYLLCKSGGRAKSAQAKFRDAGIENAIVVTGGTDAWEAANLPVVRGRSNVMPLQRQALLGAGIVNLLGVLLTLYVHPYFIGINLFVACGLMVAGALNFCLMAVVLSYMPWNRNAPTTVGTAQ